MGFIGESLQSLSEMLVHKLIKMLNFTGQAGLDIWCLEATNHPNNTALTGP